MNFTDWPRKRAEVTRTLEQEVTSILDAFRGDVAAQNAGIQVEMTVTFIPAATERFTDVEIEFEASI